MKILFADTVHPFLQEELAKRNHICETAYTKTKAEILQIIHEFDGIIIRSRFIIDKEFLEKAIKLKFIARAGSGLENIDVKFAESKGIKCLNAPEGNRQAVAEHAVGMLLGLFNHLNRANQQVRQGTWQREENRGVELSGKTVAIIGFGNNGSAFAEVLKGFGVAILVYDKYLTQYPFQSSMEEIYRKADVLSLHIPLTEETSYLVDENYISRFAKPFYLINTARGKCVKTKDLVWALQCEKILGACLDVLEYEKTSFEGLSLERLSVDLQYLFQSENVILSPHIAGWSVESHQKISAKLLQKILNEF